jgi:orotidine-5'-phosphate decarboxylase
MIRDPRQHLIVALDVPELAAARTLIARLGDDVLWYKIGLELFTVAGPEAVRVAKGEGKQVFLDLKLHDIPNTVARAVTRSAALGADLLDVHVAAGEEAMRAAATALRDAVPTCPILGVTVLTSATQLNGAGALSSDALVEEVVRRARAARVAGLDGVVCPAAATAAVRAACGDEFALLNPGIRPAGAARGDQQWIATPAAAIAAGARWLVVGRPITGAPQPAAAARAILEEIRRVPLRGALDS